jgi:hypothetical protein
MEVQQDSVLENFREDEFVSTHVASTRIPALGLWREANQTSGKNISACIIVNG